MSFELKRMQGYPGVPGPLVMIIMDGVGIFRGEQDGYPGNAVDRAAPANLYRLLETEKIVMQLKAHGAAVGLPSDDDQGNSEVGHNAFGAGRIFAQGARLVDEAIESDRLFQSPQWQELIHNAITHKTPVHFIGLVSDGGVHSKLAHVIAMLGQCDRSGVEEAYVHCLLDGRDVPPVSALRYIGELEDYLWSLRSQALQAGRTRRYFIASGGGRMVTTMDRYEADWSIVERGYHAHVNGQGPLYPDAYTAISDLRLCHRADDQNLPHWVIHAPGDAQRPMTLIRDRHNVIFFNFRGDRALEISRAFVEQDFTGFERPLRPDTLYAGMLEYDGDTHMPPRYLVSPPQINRTVSEYLARNGVSQFAISETQKYGHVTYFWNGNNSAKFNPDLEEWVEIESDKLPFDQAPRMQAREIAERTITALRSGAYRFLRLNFPNGDMVGHTGSLPAAVEAVKAVDQEIGRLLKVLDELGGTAIITADHGNCEQMVAVDPKSGNPVKASGSSYKPMTSHTTNPVPFIIHGPDTAVYEIASGLNEPGLANIAATILALLGFEKPEEYCDPLITIRR
jgi:2,3-bisphosphoglycerate-independent phosphoglycerate mutase